MFNNYFILNKLVTELNRELQGYKITRAFSFEKEKMTFILSNDSDESTLEISVNPGFPFLILKRKISIPKRNLVDFFNALLPLNIISVEIADNDRIIRIQTDKSSLYFAIRGKFTNMYLIYGDSEIESFKKSDEKIKENFRQEVLKCRFISGFNNLKIEDESIDQYSIRKKYPVIGKDIINEANLRLENAGNLSKDILNGIIREIKENKPALFIDEDTGDVNLGIESFNVFPFTRKKIFDLETKLGKLAGTHERELQRLLWDVHISRVMADAIVRFGQLRHTYVVVGWVPTANLENLTLKLKQASKEILIEALPTSRSGHHSHVPVALTTNKWLRPIQMLVGQYGHPSYGELDPTLIMAFTFPFLFGAMFGDLGQGLVLLVLGILMHNRIIMKGMQSLGLLITYCGASAAVFGYLYGSIFGFEGHLIEEYLHFHFEPMWMSPLENILSILSVAIDAGIIILIFGFLLSMFNNLRSKNWAHLLFGHSGVATFIFYLCFLALLGGFLGDTAIAPRVAVAINSLPLPFTTLAGVFAVLVMFSGFFRNMVEGQTLIEGRGVGGFLMFLVQSFMDIFETVISMLSNTLSFVRVGAFAVAHGGLSLAIFSLAGEEPDPGFLITIILGNIFIVGFEGLIVGIQTMRLHYYEILGKFFHGGGLHFEPLKLSASQEEA